MPTPSRMQATTGPFTPAKPGCARSFQSMPGSLECGDEEMSLQDLRKARKQTQVHVAKELGIKQENVSRIEKRADLLLSTLSGYVEAMGGKLRLVAEFPDRPPIALTGIAALDKESRPPKR